jgi:hypothetical protein
MRQPPRRRCHHRLGASAAATPETAPRPEDLMSWDDGDFNDASFGIHKCRRYHQMLRDRFGLIHRMLVSLNVFAASGVFFAVQASWPTLTSWLALTVATVSIFDYIFSAEKASALHDDLARRFTNLAADLESLEPTIENLRRVRADRLRIEADEPALKRLIDIRAANDEARSRGVRECDLAPLSLGQRIMGHHVTYGVSDLERWKAEREATET